MKITKILRIINELDMDGVDEVVVPTKDLQVVRRHVIEQADIIKNLIMDKHILEAKLGLCQLDKPVRFDMYV